MKGGRFPFWRCGSELQPEQQPVNLGSHSPASSEPATHEPVNADLVADLAIEFWRLERRIGRVVEKGGTDSITPLVDSIRRLDAVMFMHGLELRIHEGEQVIDGVGFEVLHVREAATPLVVIETIQPTVVLGDRVIRHGKVIAGAVSEGKAL